MRRRTASVAFLVPLLSAAAVVTSIPVVVPAAAATSAVIEGPDVSSYQHPNGVAINWTSVRQSGRKFGIVKATEGANYVNPWFGRDYAAVKAAYLVRGSYHFARPGYPIASTAVAQARYYAAQLGDVTAKATLPPALDLEVTGGLSKGELVVWAQDFLLELRRLTGRTPMLYTYPYFWQSSLGDPAALSRYPLWMAAYSSPVDSTAALWQYTSTASVAGIRGGVDMSRLTGVADWPLLSDGTQPSAWSASEPGAAQSVTASPGVRSAVVSWLPPDAGTSPLTGYDVRVVETGQVVHVGGTATSATVPGLTTGESYSFTVTPQNAVGAGPSATTGSVVPVVPTSLRTSASAAAVYIGSSVSYAGVLTNGDTGAPLANAGVQVFTRPAGSTSWGFIGRSVTDANGRVQLTLTPTRSIDVRLYYPATTGVQTAATLTTTLVRSLVTTALSRSSIKAGSTTVLSGAISPRFAGVTVVRQIYTASGWRNAGSTLTRAGGAYGFQITPRGRSTTQMRAVVAADRGRAPGYSNVVVLRVS